MIKGLLIGLLILVWLGAIFVTIFGGLFVGQSVAIKALETQGYSSIRIIDRAWFTLGFRGGSPSDAARFTCIATNPTGKKVTIYVFVGWPFKGATIRTM